MNIVKNWFGTSFEQLDPKLQDIHLSKSCLSGSVDISIKNNFFSKRVAKKLGIPCLKQSSFYVKIWQKNSALYWQRCFDNNKKMLSVFTPIGKKDNGYWEEKTGFIKLKLDVDIVNGAWVWKNLGASIFGVWLPKFLQVKTEAYKKVENNQYKFYVSISLPLVKDAIVYQGLLDINQ